MAYSDISDLMFSTIFLTSSALFIKMESLLSLLNLPTENFFGDLNFLDKMNYV